MPHYYLTLSTFLPDRRRQGIKETDFLERELKRVNLTYLSYHLGFLLLFYLFLSFYSRNITFMTPFGKVNIRIC